MILSKLSPGVAGSPHHRGGQGLPRGDVGNPDLGGLFLKPESRSSARTVYNLIADVSNIPPGLMPFFCVLSDSCPSPI